MPKFPDGAKIWYPLTFGPNSIGVFGVGSQKYLVKLLRNQLKTIGTAHTSEE